MRFGEFIKSRRLKMKMGLRVFASKIGEDPGNWCRIEKGHFSAPSDIKLLNKIAKVLNLSEGEKEKLFDIAAKESHEKVPADIRRQLKENEIVPILFRTIDKKKLTKEQLKKLIERIKDEY
ncbi:MAG: helix-turn-helix domain-containing protein [Candidatus Omnitrophica bacterium]|nr:helix-turn-helix domain-containing protein [Candidatus Omnitrophota bacterium]MBU4589314.1 helix-turn-helix domain-containing protein [Candidatus Omnitrophota bacterium]